jgi:hypothetical protein
LPRLVIPPSFVSSVKKLALFSVADFEDLTRALETAAQSGLKGTASRMGASVPGIPQADLEPLMEAIFAFSYLRSGRDLSLEELTAEIVEAVQRFEPEKLELKEAERASLAERLSRLLKIDTLVIATKARDLQTDHDHIYSSARVLTDVRPVFAVEPEKGPIGFVLFHNLKLTYTSRDSRGERSLFIALDESDISNLRKVLERAETKAVAIRAKFAEGGMNCLDLRGE